jgi:superfamily II DNA or RNA helicase
MKLRDYQQQAVDDISAAYLTGARRPLLVAPTGAGKTVIFSHITQNESRAGHRVTILVHRQELVDQTSRALSRYGVPHGVIQGGRTDSRANAVQVASVQTLARRLEKYAQPDLVIVDEAHHAAAGTWGRVLAHYEGARVLGVTATPERLDGKGLAASFDRLIMGPDVADLIARGYLSRPVYWSKPLVDTTRARTTMGDFNIRDLNDALTGAIMGDAVTEYKRRAGGLPAIAFCPSIAKAEEVATAFRGAGFRWDVISGELEKGHRRELVEMLGDGRLNGLSACEIVSEGFDLPVVTAAILLRPTQSLALHLQQIGRVLRVHDGKQNAVIIDHAGNLHRHGAAEDAREWSLDGRPKKKGKSEAVMKDCPWCFCCVHLACATCPECGHDFEVKVRKIKQVEGNLVEYKASEDNVAELMAKAKTLAEFQRIAKMKGYKPGWAWHQTKKPKFSYNL